METRARYLLVGFFSLAVIAAGFLFVYWLNSAGGLGARAVYQIRFQSAVIGLRPGSAVLFNGIRVGDVTALAVVPDEPRDVRATISVQEGTPVRADTAVSVESQGLMGAPVVMLRGGKPDAPALPTARAAPGTLVADPTATEDVTHAATETLRLVRGVVAENAEPLRSAISNINTFSAALARNSEHLDGIVQGLLRLTGGGDRKPTPVFDLPAPRDIPRSAKAPTGPVTIAEPKALVLYDTQRILARGPRGDTVPIEGTQWSDSLPKLVQVKMLQAFENAGYQAVAAQPLDVNGGEQLLVEIRSFEIETAAAEAQIELAARIQVDGQFVATRTFRATTPLRSADSADAAGAFAEAFAQVARDLIAWWNDRA
jgi:phospholipid/cholesterol/gamma-HCH transport system substrate-binding protein